MGTHPVSPPDLWMSVSSLQEPSLLDLKVKNSDMYGERNKTDMIKVVGMIQIMKTVY